MENFEKPYCTYTIPYGTLGRNVNVMVVIMNFFGHDHDHYKKYDRCDIKCSIADLVGNFCPTELQKSQEYVKNFHYETKTSSCVASYPASPK